MRVIPPFATRKTGTALICGPAPSLFADFTAARALCPDAELFALSWAIRAVRAAHVVSLHYETCAIFRELGAHDHPGHDFLIHSQPPRRGGPEHHPAVDHFWDVAADASNTAVAACLIALEMGFARVILAGVLLDGTPGYAVETGREVFWQGGVSATAGQLAMDNFAAHREVLAGKVFAMSGAPRRMFGPPPELTA